MYELIFWGALFVVLVIAESVSLQLISIWFAAGSAAAFLAAIFHAPILVQILLFVAVSVVLLVFTRPLIRKTRVKPTPTNADAVIGRGGIVTEAVDNLSAKGRAKIDGVSWTARSAAGEPIPAGTVIRVVRIEGVTAFVQPEESK